MSCQAPSLSAVIRRVQAFVRTQPGGKKRLCIEAGLAFNTLGRVESPAWRPSLETLSRLERLVPPDFRVPEDNPPDPPR
jgi:hypothetical protein